MTSLFGWAVGSSSRRGRRESRGSLENPNTPLNGRTLDASWGGYNTHAGAVVSEESALTCLAFLACVKILSEAIACLPLQLMEKLPDGSARPAPEREEFALFRHAPNPDMTDVVFKETAQAHLNTWGNHVSRLDFSQSTGRPLGAYPLEPSRLDIVRMPETLEIRYKYTSPDGTFEMLHPDEVIHVPGLGFDGLRGFSPVAMARQALGIAMEAERFNANFFSNGAWMGGVLQHPGELGEKAEENLIKTWREDKGGGANAWAPAILEEGMEWKQLTVPREDALFLSLRTFTKLEMATMHRIPPHMLAHLEKGVELRVDRSARRRVRPLHARDLPQKVGLRAESQDSAIARGPSPARRVLLQVHYRRSARKRYAGALQGVRPGNQRRMDVGQ